MRHTTRTCPDAQDTANAEQTRTTLEEWPHASMREDHQHARLRRTEACYHAHTIPSSLSPHVILPRAEGRLAVSPARLPRPSWRGAPGAVRLYKSHHATGGVEGSSRLASPLSSQNGTVSRLSAQTTVGVAGALAFGESLAGTNVATAGVEATVGSPALTSSSAPL